MWKDWIERKQFTNKELKNFIGRIGESYVKNHLTNNSNKVLDLINPFDSEKDFIVNGKTVEVKTQHVLQRFEAFSINSFHYKKCKNVDILFFVELPHPENNFHILIWKTEYPKERVFKTVQNLAGDRKLISVYDLNLVETIKPNLEELEIIKALDTSKSYGYKKPKKLKEYVKKEYYRLQNKKI